MRYKTNHQDAIAVLNDAFLKIVTHLDTIREEVPFDAWAKRIMLNTLISEYHKDKKDSVLIPMDDMMYFEGDDGRDDLDDLENTEFTIEDLQHYLKKLPASTQEVFNLYVFDGYTHKEIARILEISEGTSKWHLSNARKLLQELLKSSKYADRIMYKL